jgi:hypothetical protein
MGLNVGSRQNTQIGGLNGSEPSFSAGQKSLRIAKEMLSVRLLDKPRCSCHPASDNLNGAEY